MHSYKESLILVIWTQIKLHKIHGMYDFIYKNTSQRYNSLSLIIEGPVSDRTHLNSFTNWDQRENSYKKVQIWH